MRFSAASTADRFLPGPIAARALPLLRKLDAVIFTADDRAEAGRTSLAAFAIRVISAVIALVSQILMARWMGSFEYGIFVLVWTAMIIVGTLSCLGFHTSIVRYIPQYRQTKDLAKLRGVMTTSRAFVLVISSLLTLIGLAGLWEFAGELDPHYIIPFYLGVICLPMIALSNALEGTARANSWAMLSLGPIYLLRPVLILLFMTMAIYADFPATAETALAAAVIATFATTLFQIATIHPPTSREVRHVRSGYSMREWVVVSLPIFLIEGIFFLLTNADVLMVGWFLTPHEVGVYFATVKTLALVHFVYYAVKAGVAQRYAQYAHGNDHARLAAFARETASWTFWPSLLLAAAVLAAGKPLLSLFGPGFSEGYPLLMVLVAGVIARSAVGPAESLLTMSGKQNICAVVYAAALTINICLNLILIPMLGLWGAALSTSIAMACEAAMLAFTVWRTLGIVMVVKVGGGRIAGEVR